ncbi:MAG: InlB B-repeat-containing protein [Candidatus Izemoplasmatales bacterium]
MPRRFPPMILILLSALVLTACGGTTTLPDLTNLSIEAIDEADIPAGVYEIPFNRAEIEAYAAYYEVSIELTAIDSDGTPVDLDGDSITIVEGEVYTVTIRATVGSAFDESRTITLTAVGASVSHTVTFDLNGAPMTAPITRSVAHGEPIADFPAEPLLDDYAFGGWCRDAACTTPWSEEDDVVTADLTLYVKWNPVVVEHDGSDLFINCAPGDASRIEGDLPVQIYSLWMGFAYSLTDEESRPLEFGLVYSTTDGTPGYFEDGVIVHPIAEFDENDLAIIWFAADTLPLADETHYTMRAYALYEHDLYYGEIVSYDTARLVGSAQSVGLQGIVSGGRYYIDNGTAAYRPAMFDVAVAEGYEAFLGTNPYHSYEQIRQSGMRSMFVVDTATGVRYLHVFELTLRNSPAVVAYEGFATSVQLGEWHVTASYGITLPFAEEYDYHIEEYGVLFSTATPYLELGREGVHRRAGGDLDETNGFANEDDYTLPTVERTLYVRGYAIVDGRTCYSATISSILFEEDLSGASYETGPSYTEYEDFTSSRSGYSVYTSPNVVHVVTTFGETPSAVEYVGNFSLTAPGVYYVRQAGIAFWQKVVILEPQGVIEGVADGATYQDKAVVVSTTWNATLWLSKDGGPEVAIGSGVTLTEPGVYVVSIYLYGTTTSTFTIE